MFHRLQCRPNLISTLAQLYGIDCVRFQTCRSNAGPILGQRLRRWPSISPALGQLPVVVYGLAGNDHKRSVCHTPHPSSPSPLTDRLIQWWVNVRPPSATLGQHYTNIISAHCVSAGRHCCNISANTTR